MSVVRRIYVAQRKSKVMNETPEASPFRAMRFAVTAEVAAKFERVVQEASGREGRALSPNEAFAVAVRDGLKALERREREALSREVGECDEGRDRGRGGARDSAEAGSASGGGAPPAAPSGRREPRRGAVPPGPRDRPSGRSEPEGPTIG
jgi:hypothetical protein